jgi:hypothetical protein
MRRLLPYIAPYIAVLVFWMVLENAWLTVLAYHAQILVWSRHRLGRVARGWDARWFLYTAVPCALAGPLLYAFLPTFTGHADLAAWLGRYGLGRGSLAAMIPYFGVVHPILEQAHWGALRARNAGTHAAFAGYHALVLYTVLAPAWLVLCIAVLAAASLAWAKLQERTSGLLVPVLGHALADLGVVLAVWTRTA